MPSRAGSVFPTLLIALALGFIALVAVMFASDKAADAALELLKSSHERELMVNDATRGALRLVIDLEAEQREFELTGSAVFLERYEQARGQLPTELARLAELVKDDPVCRDLVGRLSSLVDGWIVEVARPAIAARRAAGSGAITTLPSAERIAYPGESLLRSSRTLSTQLRAQIRIETREAERRGADQRRNARRGIGVGAILVGLLIFLGGWRATARLGRDISRVASRADRLAAGDYQVAPPGERASSLLGRIDNALATASHTLRGREIEANTLLAVSRELGAAPSLIAVAASVQAALDEALPGVRIALLRIEGDRFRIAATAPMRERPSNFFDWEELGPTSLIRRMRDARATIVSNDVSQHVFSEDAFVESTGAVAWAGVPIVIGNQVVGALSTALFKGRFEDAQVRFVETLVEQIAQQIDATALRESLAQKNEELRRATTAKSGFLAMMSHELRTPLNSVIGFSEVLADQKFGPLNEKQARFMRNVLESGRHLLRLINDLLDLSKIEAGRLDVGRQVCAARNITDEVVTSLQIMASGRSIQLTVQDATPPNIWADPVRMKQILYNFISNALKFTPQGGKIDVSFTHDGTTVRASVRDNGPGISAEDQALLFQPFSQLRSEKESASSLAGTGLGLALARQFATLMGGRVGVESEPGAGATFWVEMQRVEVSGSAAPKPEVPVSSNATPLALLVDDDAAARELIKLTLQAAGYRTVEAATGEQALAEARRLHPQLITLDVCLPGIDGWDVLRILRTDEDTKDIRVIVLSIQNERQKALSLGADEHMVKPLDYDELRRMVTEARPSLS